MRVIITGLPYFAEILQSDMKNFDKKNKYIFCNTYYSFFDKIKFLLLLPFSDLIISLNGVTDKSGSMELAVKLRKKIFMLWQGTDVLLAKERYENNTIYSKYIDYSIHFSDSFPLIEELKEIGIAAKYLCFKYIEIKKDPIPIYDSLSVYTYIAEGKEDFYGLKILLPIFKKFSNTEFKIIGTKGDTCTEFSNVKYLGWIDPDMYHDICNSTPIFIRLTEHDGYSRSVLEAISFGNEVIWNKEHPVCHFVERDSEDVSVKLSAVMQLLKDRNMKRNKNNIEWAKENLSKEKILGGFLAEIKKYV